MRSSRKSTETSNAITTLSDAIKTGFQWWMKYVPTQQRWSDINIEKFLRCYQNQPILWDKTHESYKKRPMRMQAYTAIVEDLGLIDIGERECMDLVQHLKKLYIDYRQGEKDRARCRYNYRQPPHWYCILDEIVERAIERTGEKKACRAMIDPSADEVKIPQDVCRPIVYIEDNWTPQHFKTNVADWFTNIRNEKLPCTCQPNLEKICTDLHKNTSSSTDIGDGKKSTGSVTTDDTVVCPSRIPCHTGSIDVLCDGSLKEVERDLDKDNNSCCIRKSGTIQEITIIPCNNSNKSSSQNGNLVSCRNKFEGNFERVGNCSCTMLQREIGVTSDLIVSNAKEELMQNCINKEFLGREPLRFNSDCVLRKKKSSSVSCRSYGSTLSESSSSNYFCYSPLSLSEIDIIIQQKRTFASWAR